VKRLEETHGTQFELIRHFLRCMFDGEWSSAPGQWRSGAIGVLSLVLPAGLLLLKEGRLDSQYASAPSLAAVASGAGGIRDALAADELSLITLLICVTGLIALLEWQSLFPGKRDYLALASLPVRAGQIFAARFTAVAVFSATIVAGMNLLPSLLAALDSGGGWRLGNSYFARAGAQALASGLACFFVFAAIVALQGVLLNLLPAGLFARVSVMVQGALAGVFLLGALYSWSIRDWTAEDLARLPAYGAWLPPVWFAAFDRVLAGDSEIFYRALAQRAYEAAGIAVAVAVVGYLVACRRYRKLLLEAPLRLATPRVWRWSLLTLLARSPRRRAIMDFLVKTVVRSRTHRVLWFVYLGAAAAVLINSSLIDGGLVAHSGRWRRELQFVVHFWPLACSAVVLNGFRHVLSIPADLSANWIFRIAESQGRQEWMSAVECFIIAYAIAPIYLALFPVALAVLPWPEAVRLMILHLLVSLAMFEALFYSWQKLPFTCSHVPGEKPLTGVVAKYLVMICVLVPVVSLFTGVAAQKWFLFPVFLAILAALWSWLRYRRREGWGEANLLYEDLPAVVTDLGIKEVTFAGAQAQLRREGLRSAPPPASR